MLRIIETYRPSVYILPPFLVYALSFELLYQTFDTSRRKTERIRPLKNAKLVFSPEIPLHVLNSSNRESSFRLTSKHLDVLSVSERLRKVGRKTLEYFAREFHENLVQRFIVWIIVDFRIRRLTELELVQIFHQRRLNHVAQLL